MKEPRRASSPRPPASSVPPVVVRGKGVHATGSMLAVALFMAAGLCGVWWIVDQRGQNAPPKTARKPAAAVVPEGTVAPATEETAATETPVAPAPETPTGGTH